MKTLDEAKAFLNQCVRWELRDHAFGDTEMGWSFNGTEAAGGYFNGSHSHVWIGLVGVSDTFDGKDAQELRKCGTLRHVDRNDSTGPDEYREGVVMPGLTTEDVLDELTGG